MFVWGRLLGVLELVCEIWPYLVFNQIEEKRYKTIDPTKKKDSDAF